MLHTNNRFQQITFDKLTFDFELHFELQNGESYKTLITHDLANSLTNSIPHNKRDDKEYLYFIFV